MNPSFLERFVKYRKSSKIALVCGDSMLTYAQLYKRCAALASKLRSFGVGIDSTDPGSYDIYNPKMARYSPWVIIISDRREDAVIGIIATFMAGGAYVLMGTEAPESYIDGVIDNTAAAVTLRSGDFDIAGEVGDFPYVFPKESEIACAIFTSGSTGRPKGAVLEHRVINEMISWQIGYMNPTGWTATAMYAPFSFIAALWEIFLPLACGLTLHILDENTRRDLFALESYIESTHISYMFLPPNIAEIFTQIYKGNSLKYLRVAGGRLKSCGDPGGRYEIMYHLGMAENGGSVTFHPIREAMSGDIPIGKAWNKTQIYLIGETGEMAVSGPSLFRGYLSRREETFRKLVKNPYSTQAGYEMMYLSGDLVRTDENGNLIHIGRSDWDIKIRDMKVNPMQVETALAQCVGVSECCVTAQPLDGEDALIGWIVGDINTETLKTELAAVLPEYMIPSVFVELDVLPRGLNGKIDRGSLVYAREDNKGTEYGYMVGQDYASVTEAKIAELFKRVLGSTERVVCAEDNLLSLGGNSLKFMQLQADIAREFSVNIPYTVLFSNPTPRMIAAILQNQTEYTRIPPAEPMEAYPISAPMRQMWLLWRTGQDRGKYTVSIKCHFTGEIDRLRLKSSLDELVRSNAILRSRFEERGDEVFQIVEENAQVSVRDFQSCEFDLTVAPILDVSLSGNVLTFTSHHIIADAIGMRMLLEDFWTLYSGAEPQKSTQVHDVTMWSLHEKTDRNESHWLQTFRDGVPLLKLPYDFPRPERLSYSATESVFFDDNKVLLLNKYASEHDATLFQLFLTGYAMLLSKLSGSESVVVGVPFAGREHPDMAQSIGMFVRTLPVRLDVSGMELDEALRHTCERFLDAWEHQTMSLERLAQMIDVPRIASRSPFYDVMINYAPLPQPLRDDFGLHPEILRGDYPGALFDLVLDLREETDGVSAVFTYASELLKPERVRDWAEALKKLLLSHKLELDVTEPVISSAGDEYSTTYFDESSTQGRELLQAWKDVLEKEDITPDDDFFRVGGTSLAAIRVEAALFEKGWLLSAADIFQNPRLCDMAALMTPADEIDWEEAFV